MRTTTTIPANSPTSLCGLQAAFRDEVEALISKYPAQEANRASYGHMLLESKLGVMTHRFASKGDFTVLPVGARVLILGEEEDGDVSVFAPCVRGSLHMSRMPVSWVRIL